MDYTFLGKIQYLIGKSGYYTEGTEYAEGVSVYLLIPEEETEAFNKDVVAATDGRLKLEVTGRIMGAMVNGEVRLYEGCE